MNLWKIDRSQSADYEQPTVIVIAADDENTARLLAAQHVHNTGGASWAIELVLPAASTIELVGLALETHDAGTVVVMA